MTIATAYSSWAPTYDSDRNLTRDLDAEVTRRIFSAERFQFVVEAGCGTGKNTEYFSRIADNVLAPDFSEGMLAVARSRVASFNVQFQQADLCLEWPCAPHCAQLVSFNLVLEHIESLEPVLQRAAASIAPGGRVFVSELHPFKQYQSSQARFRDRTGQEVKVPAFTHNVSDFLNAAEECGLSLVRFNEWWHSEDLVGSVPRLATFIFHLSHGRAAA